MEITMKNTRFGDSLPALAALPDPSCNALLHHETLYGGGFKWGWSIRAGSTANRAVQDGQSRRMHSEVQSTEGRAEVAVTTVLYETSYGFPAHLQVESRDE